jgi:hypothetical protein
MLPENWTTSNDRIRLNLTFSSGLQGYEHQCPGFLRLGQQPTGYIGSAVTASTRTCPNAHHDGAWDENPRSQ